MTNKSKTFRRAAAAAAAICLAFAFAFAEETGADKLGFGTSVTVSAYDEYTYKIGNAEVTYTTDADNNVTITKVNAGSDTTIEIPETISNAGTVTVINSEAFKDCNTLTSITLPPNITTIRNDAFSGCTALKSINIPDKVEKIYHNAFENCSSLESIIIPSKVTSVGEEAFKGCTSLKTIFFPYDLVPSSVSYWEIPAITTQLTYTQDSTTGVAVTYANSGGYSNVTIPENISGGTVKTVFIPETVSKYCTVTAPATAAKITYEKDSNDEVTITKVEPGADQTSIEIPPTIDGGTVETIGENAFNGCTTLTSITLPDSITSIESLAFYGCTSLQSIKIPDKVESIGEYAFSACNKLEKIELSSNIISIGDMAFQGCRALKTIDIPNSVTSIGNSAFSDCILLTDITIPDSVESVGSSAFERCSALTSCTFPYNDKVSVPKDIFTGCDALKTVFLPYGISDATTNIPQKPAKIYYTKNANSVTIFKVSSGNQTSIEIPETIGNIAVTTIGDNSFNGCSIESIELPTSVTSIGNEAFMNCSDLTEINIPYGVQSIGNSAFKSCGQLVKLDLPQSITSIGDSAFYGCEHLKTINIPDNVTKIETGTFYGCRSLTSINIPSKITDIGTAAFRDCSQLKAIDIPDSVKSIGSEAFEFCYGLTSIVVPYSVQSIGADAFAASTIQTVFVPKHLSSTSVHQRTAKIVYTKDADGVTINQSETGMQTSIEIPQTINGGTVKTIGDNAFDNTTLGSNCSSLESITLPGSITSIGKEAFKATQLTGIEIPDSVTNIGSYAFSECIKLKTVKLPKNLTTIEENTFANCAFTSIDIPDKVTDIKKSAFFGCTYLENINIPQSVETIGQGAFSSCQSLSAITIPSNVTRIEQGTFSYCMALEGIDIHDNITFIGQGAFTGCNNLKSLTIPPSVKTIESGAFNGCNSIKYAFLPYGSSSYGADFIPAGTAKIYYTKDSTTGVVTITGIEAGSQTEIIIPKIICGGEVRIIGDKAFEDNTALTKIELPDSITSLGEYAFTNCSNLTDIKIPDKVTFIGEAAFSCCSSLESITIPDGVTSISTGLFLECKNLKTVTLPDNVNSIGENAFEKCKNLVSIKLPANLDTIYNYAFYKCTSLASVDLPSKLRLIDPNAFKDCESLTSVTIPESVTSIGAGAFDGCISLSDVKLPKGLEILSSFVFSSTAIKSIVIPETVTQINDSAFKKCSVLESIELPPNVSHVGDMAFENCTALKNVFYNTGTDIFDSKIPDTSAKTKYEIRDGLAYILEVVPDSSNSLVVIHDTVCGYEVMSTTEEYRQYVSEKGHTHKGGTATCTEQALCDICGTGYDSTDLTNHDADTSTWKYDDTEHWNPCLRTGCEEHLNAAAHNFDSGIVTTEPTETAEGVKTYTCETCGYKKTESVPKLGHTPSAEWTYDSENHWKICTKEGCGEKLELAAHSFDNGIVTTEPTETAEGVKTYTCETCGYKKTESVPKLGHTPSTDWTYDSENHWKICTKEGCGEKLELAAHTFDNGVVTTEPTKTAEGVKTYTCETCGYKKTESIEKLPSDPAAAVYPITVSGGVTIDKSAAAAGETVSVSAPFGYDIIVSDINGNTVAKISESGSFVMPASKISITVVRSEVFTHMSNAWSHSYVYSYDSDMSRIKVNSDIRKGIITIDLGADYADRSFTVYSGRKNTSKKIISGTLDENGRYVFNAEEGKNYTLVVE